MSEWQPIETAPRDTRIWAWGDNWNWRNGSVAFYHSNFNGHKDVISQGGCGGATFRIASNDAPSHWQPLPEPPGE